MNQVFEQSVYTAQPRYYLKPQRAQLRAAQRDRAEGQKDGRYVKGYRHLRFRYRRRYAQQQKTDEHIDDYACRKCHDYHLRAAVGGRHAHI
jgi:hypothetical protein